jgi:acyl-coenzyme A thioesterase PaaI-like protein
MAMSPEYANFLEYISIAPVSTEDVEYFSAIPGTRRFVSDAQFKAVPTPSLVARPGKSDNAFIAKTMRTPEGLGRWLMLMRKALEAPSPSQVSNGPPTPMALQRLAARPDSAADFVILAQLGPDLDGFAGRVHGGALCAILDEILSLCVEYHRQATSQSRAQLYTAQLNVSFRRAVDTPSVVVIKTWLEAKEARKWWVRGQVCDAQNEVLTEAEGLWLAAKESTI